MFTATTRLQILENAGYAYSFDLRSYINQKARKLFSLEFVQDRSEGELQARVGEPCPATSVWRFYFNSPLSEAVKRELSEIFCI